MGSPSLIRVRTPVVALVAVALCTAIFAPADAAAKPRFAKRYSGSLSGVTTVAFNDGDTITATWSVKGLRLRLRKVNKQVGNWTAVYKVTGGRVNFTQIKTGACTHSVTDDFALIPALPNPPVSEPLAFTSNSRGQFYALGGISVDNRYNTTETCVYPEGGSPDESPVEVMVPQLFDPLGRRAKPGRRVRGSYRMSDKRMSSTETITRKWDLKPRS